MGAAAEKAARTIIDEGWRGVAPWMDNSCPVDSVGELLFALALEAERALLLAGGGGGEGSSSSRRIMPAALAAAARTAALNLLLPTTPDPPPPVSPATGLFRGVMGIGVPTAGQDRTALRLGAESFISARRAVHVLDVVREGRFAGSRPPPLATFCPGPTTAAHRERVSLLAELTAARNALRSLLAPCTPALRAGKAQADGAAARQKAEAEGLDAAAIEIRVESAIANSSHPNASLGCCGSFGPATSHIITLLAGTEPSGAGRSPLFPELRLDKGACADKACTSCYIDVAAAGGGAAAAPGEWMRLGELGGRLRGHPAFIIEPPALLAARFHHAGDKSLADEATSLPLRDWPVKGGTIWEGATAMPFCPLRLLGSLLGEGAEIKPCYGLSADEKKAAEEAEALWRAAAAAAAADACSSGDSQPPPPPPAACTRPRCMGNRPLLDGEHTRLTVPEEWRPRPASSTAAGGVVAAVAPPLFVMVRLDFRRDISKTRQRDMRLGKWRLDKNRPEAHRVKVWRPPPHHRILSLSRTPALIPLIGAAAL